MRIERLVPCPPEDLWRALIQNTELGKHGAMLPRASRRAFETAGTIGLRIAAGARVRLGADVLRWELQPQGCMTRLVFTAECAAQWMAYLESIEALATRAAEGRESASELRPRTPNRASARQGPQLPRWAASRRSSRPTAPRPPAATRSPNGGSSRTRAGPGAHSTGGRRLFVIEGTMSFLLGDEWTHAAAGSFVLVPAGVTHDFENRGSARAGVLKPRFPAVRRRHAEHRPVVRREPARKADGRRSNGVLSG